MIVESLERTPPCYITLLKAHDNFSDTVGELCRDLIGMDTIVSSSPTTLRRLVGL